MPLADQHAPLELDCKALDDLNNPHKDIAYDVLKALALAVILLLRLRFN